MADGSSFTGKTLPKDVARIGEGNAMEKPVKLFGKWDTEGCVLVYLFSRVMSVLIVVCPPLLSFICSVAWIRSILYFRDDALHVCDMILVSKSKIFRSRTTFKSDTPYGCRIPRGDTLRNSLRRRKCLSWNAWWTGEHTFFGNYLMPGLVSMVFPMNISSICGGFRRPYLSTFLAHSPSSNILQCCG